MRYTLSGTSEEIDMLSPDDTDLVNRESAIPGLATLLDPETFFYELRPYLPKTVGNIRLTNIHYKPRTNCLVNYWLGGPEIGLNIYAKAHGPDRWRTLQKERETRSVNGSLTQTKIILEDKGIVVRVFPNDGKLRALKCLGTAHKRRKLLRTLFRDQPELWDGTLQTLHYRPELRYVARLETKEGSQAVVRFYHPAAYSNALTNAMAFHSRRYLRIPKYLGSSEPHKVLALEWLRGHALSEILAGDLNFAIRAVEDTAVALAEFHSQGAQGLSSRTGKNQAEILLGWADWLGFLCPRLAGLRIQAQWLARKVASEPPVSRPIHGDFWASQVIVADRHVGFVDLDEAVQSDPRIDLGFFIADLEYYALFGSLPPSRLSTLIDVFLGSYQRAIGKELPADLEVYTALGLFHRSRHPFQYHEADWIKRTAQILDRMASIITKSSSIVSSSVSHSVSPVMPVRVHVADPFDASQDKKMPFLARALDPKEVESYLQHLIHSLGGNNVTIRLREIRVVRYKPSRRCLIEYEVEVQGEDTPKEVITLLGKARRTGLDVATYSVCEGLWSVGFGSSSADGISIPQPIGTVPELQMWFQRKVQGIRATDLLVKKDGIELARRIAEAVHKVHKTNIPSPKQHTIADELSILRERLAKVAEENPVWTGRIGRLLDACYRLGSCVPELATVGIHRDFYPDQVIVDGTRIYLTDFDLYCKGDPGLDTGNFVGHLQEHAFRTMGDIHALADREEALVERFLELSGESRRRSVEVYTALTLVRHISISMQFPDRRPFTEALLSICEQRLSAQLREYLERGI